MLFKELIAVYNKNNTETVHTNAELLIVKAAGTYTYHAALKN
jgi:hypothetical protein